MPNSELSPARKVGNLVLQLLACVILVPIISCFVVPALMDLADARDFDKEEWAAPERPSERYYMMGDVEDFLDEHPTREQVTERLGVPDTAYLCSGACWDLGSRSGFKADFLELKFDPSGRLLEYAVRSH